MIELNKVLIVGRLSRDPECRSTTSGKAIASMSVAANKRGYGDKEDEVTFVDVTAWEKQAEFAKNYLKKGSAVFVEGRLKQESWDDKETRQKRSKLTIVAERVSFAESKAEATGERTAEPRRETRKREPEPNYGGGGTAGDDGELPFAPHKI